MFSFTRSFEWKLMWILVYASKIKWETIWSFVREQEYGWILSQKICPETDAEQIQFSQN